MSDESMDGGVSGEAPTLTITTQMFHCPVHGETDANMTSTWDPGMNLCQRCWWDHLKTVCQVLAAKEAKP